MPIICTTIHSITHAFIYGAIHAGQVPSDACHPLMMFVQGVILATFQLIKKVGDWFQTVSVHVWTCLCTFSINMVQAKARLKL